MTTRRVVGVRELGLVPYEHAFRAMRAFTSGRGPETRDEIWLAEHEPVFTLGQAGRHEHVLAPGSIPVVRSDRGGQVTYHGPGQLLFYVLLDLRRARLGVRQLVHGLEQSVIDVLANAGIRGGRRDRAPGVYVHERKVAALGLRVRGRCSYHGLALNVNMDLEPFERIEPCGFADLKVTQLASLGLDWNVAEAGSRLLECWCRAANYIAATEPPHGECTVAPHAGRGAHR